MESQQIENIRRALAGVQEIHPLVRELLCATLSRLIERGALTSQDVDSILTVGVAGCGEPCAMPNQAFAGGSSRPGDSLQGNRLVDESSEESFPASDPPSYTPPSGAGNTPDGGTR